MTVLDRPRTYPARLTDRERRLMAVVADLQAENTAQHEAITRLRQAVRRLSAETRALRDLHR